jgi:hypothetical protein
MGDNYIYIKEVRLASSKKYHLTKSEYIRRNLEIRISKRME